MLITCAKYDVRDFYFISKGIIYSFIYLCVKGRESATKIVSLPAYDVIRANFYFYTRKSVSLLEGVMLLTKRT